MESIIVLMVGILIGVAISHRKPAGNLRVDRSDPTDNPYLFLELSQDVTHVLRKKYVLFKVQTKDFVPHE